MSKKHVLFLLEAIVVVVLILFNVNTKIKVEVDAQVSETITAVTQEEFAKVNSKIDDLDIKVQNIQDDFNSDKIENYVESVKKQGSKIRGAKSGEKEWQDIHDVDINNSIKSYAKLEKWNHDTGEMSLLDPDIKLIKQYQAGEIGPGI